MYRRSRRIPSRIRNKKFKLILSFLFRTVADGGGGPFLSRREINSQLCQREINSQLEERSITSLLITDG